MIVLTTLLFYGFLAFLVKGRYQKAYLLVLVIGISALYFWYFAPEGSDLYRHYNMLQYLKGMSLSQVFSKTLVNSNDVLISMYAEGARVYLFLAYIISFLPTYNFLPFISGLIVYGLGVLRIYKEGERIKADHFTISITTLFFLACVDFRSISGIRNITAYALFAYIAYEDLVNKRNKVFCFLLYAIVAGIHNSVIILIVLRMLILIKKLLHPIAVSAIILLFPMMANGVFAILGHFTNIGFISLFVRKASIYFAEGSPYIRLFAIVRGLIMVFYLLIYLYCNKSVDFKKRYGEFGLLFVYIFIYTFAFRFQYDIFMRNELVLLFMLLPMLVYFYHNNIKVKGLTITFTKMNNRTISVGSILFCISILIIVLSLFFYQRYFYGSINECFVF